MSEFEPLEFPSPIETDEKAGKKKSKSDDSRLLDPWERYRVLTDMAGMLLAVIIRMLVGSPTA